jgi:hypothetical protein
MHVNRAIDACTRTTRQATNTQPAADEAAWRGQALHGRRPVQGCRIGGPENKNVFLTLITRVDGQARCLRVAYAPAGALILGITLMQIYWLTRSIPELSELPSGEMWRVRRAAHWKTMRHWQYWASLLGIAPCVEIGDMLIGYAPLGRFIGCIVGAFIFAQVQIHLARPYMRALLSPEHAPRVPDRP